MTNEHESPAPPQPADPHGHGAGESSGTIEMGSAAQPEKWFVPFVIIPLGLAGAIVGIVVLANFLLGQTGPRTLDENLTEIQSGGANARKQAAFRLARDFAEQVDANNKRLASAGNAPVNTLNASIPRRELAKIERAYETSKGDAETREFLIMTLGLVGDDASAEFLAKHLTSPDDVDEGNKRHLWLLLSIGRIGSERSIPALDAELTRVKANELDTGVAVALAAAYGNVPTPAGTKGLRALLAVAQGASGTADSSTGARNSSPSPWKFVRWTVAINLAKRHGLDAVAAAEATPWLLEAVEDVAADPTRVEGDRVFRASPAGGFMVANAVDKNREQAAAQILEALVAIDATSALPTLRVLSKNDPNLRIRSMALDAVARLERIAPESKKPL